MQKIAVEQSRLKIPLIFGLDVIHGFRATFPVPLAEASSWNRGLVENQLVGKQLKHHQQVFIGHSTRWLILLAIRDGEE